MYINTIKKLLKANKYTIKEIATLISLTETGLHLALKNDTLKVRDLFKIAEILDVPITDFFEEEETNSSMSFNYQQGVSNVNQQGQGINYKSVSGKKDKIINENIELLKLENIYLKDKIELQASLIEALRK